MSSFALGFATGLPLMIAVGPIAVLLIETGLGHGFRRAWTAGAGVAAADLTFASFSVVGGSVVVRVLDGWIPTLHVLAVAVLVTIGTRLVVRAHRSHRAHVDAGVAVAPPARPLPRRTGLAGRFYLLTVANPLTILAFTSLVLAGGVGRHGGRGWALGIAAASLLVHISLVAVGSGLGSVLGPRSQHRLRMAGGGVVVVLALVLAIRV